MSNQDEEIQKKLEAGSWVESDIDAHAYKKVFQSISTEPDFHLSPRFADQVLLKIEGIQHKAASREMYWLAAGVFVLVLGAIVGAVFAGFKPGFGAFKFWNSYPGLLVFAIAFLGVIQWVDKKFINTPSL
jgi:hypothetical protein